MWEPCTRLLWLPEDEAFPDSPDKKGIQAQWDGAIATVKKYMDHPAILFWGIGNEVYLNCATEAEKVAYSKFLGKLCKEIKKIDNKHLISSSCAWSIGVPYWEKYCKDIDVYGVNSYGAGVGALAGIDVPLFPRYSSILSSAALTYFVEKNTQHC